MTLLLYTHRKIVFIHDTYIFASITHAYASQSIIHEFHSHTKDARHRFFKKKLGIEDIPFNKVSFEKFVQAIKIPNTYEYIMRGLDRDTIIDLTIRGLLWFIPFKNIIKVGRGRIGLTDILEITYRCPLTGANRVFRTIYDDKLMDKIKQLCSFNKVVC